MAGNTDICKRKDLQWANNFSRFVADIRTDLNISNLPIVFARIGTTTLTAIFPYWSVVQSQQLSIKLPNVTMIETYDLPLHTDGIHFSVAGYTALGQRFAYAMNSVLFQ